MHKIVSTTAVATPSHSLIARLDADERIAGTYRYLGGTRRRRADGHESWHVQLTDRSGVLDTYVSAERIGVLYPRYPLPHNTLVFAEFRTLQYRGRLVAELLELDPMVASADIGAVVDRLPRPATPVPQCLDLLSDLLQGLTVPALRGFAEQVLARDDLALAWLANRQNGFMNAMIAAQIAVDMPYFQAQERDLIAVGALFRDLGRVALPPERPLWHRIPTGMLTIERCGAALAWLEKAWPEGAGSLRQIWAGDADGADPSQATVLGHAVGLMARMARGDVSGAPWLAAQRRLTQ